MDKDKIKSLLEQKFNREPIFPKKRHILFWYDKGAKAGEVIDELDLENVKIIKLAREVTTEKTSKGKEEIIEQKFLNIFKTKYTLEAEDLDSNFLIYAPYEKPRDEYNWLLDIELYSEIFSADNVGMLLEEFAMSSHDTDVRLTLEKYEGFFGAKERKMPFISLLPSNRDSITAEEIEFCILGTITKAKSSDPSDIFKTIILDKDKLVDIEKWNISDFLYKELSKKFGVEFKDFDSFIKHIMITHFYRSIQALIHPNLKSFSKGKVNELYLIGDELLQNKNSFETFSSIIKDLADNMNINKYISDLALDKLSFITTFELIDKTIIKELLDRLNRDLKDYDTYLNIIKIRKDCSLWYSKYANYYGALEAAINLFAKKENFFILESFNFDDYYKEYTNSYYVIDRLYRDFVENYDLIKNTQESGIIDEIYNKISYFYSVNYLEKLLPYWNRTLENSKNSTYLSQLDFYQKEVSKVDTRVAVIISDGLRYEVAKEIEENLIKNTSAVSIETVPMMTLLPSKTYVGMGALLPHNTFELDTENCYIDGLSTKGTDNRDKILKSYEANSSAISFAEFFGTKQRKDQEAFVKGKKLIYIYHNDIDKTGDDSTSQGKTFEACRRTINEIQQAFKTLSSLGVVNIFLTADHGFLYEKTEIVEHNKLEAPSDYTFINKRYLLNSKSIKDKNLNSFVLPHFKEETYGAFPYGAQRIKAAGGGLQYVHGGASPQEMIVPLLKYRAGQSSTKAKKVNIRIGNTVSRITSNIQKFTCFQIEPVNTFERVIERDVRIALYSATDIRISNEERILLNSLEGDRAYSVSLTLRAGDNKKAVLKVIDSETGDILDSKTYEISLAISSDFDF